MLGFPTVGRTRAGRIAAVAVAVLALPGCGSRDGRDAKMDEIDSHLAAIDTLTAEMPKASPAAAREKALAAKVHLDGVWAAVDSLKESFRAVPPSKAQAARFGAYVDKIQAAGDKTVEGLQRYNPHP